jgi:hypothetical protein
MEEKTNGLHDSMTRLKSLNHKDMSTTNHMQDDDDEEIDDHSSQLVELNNRMKTDFMSYCFSFFQEDEEARECIQIVWNKYLQCVGDVAMVNRKKTN